ncbi:MAG: T9SS type A sorting domain-containing protein [Saprospiraceae bacterium]|nr:T9SS type A sorting domain-containing protein [Saprospiraceae bacterium]
MTIRVFEIGLIENAASIQSIQIFDMLGKLVYDKKYDTELKAVTVKMDAPKAGTYIYKVITSGGKVGSGNLVIE